MPVPVLALNVHVSRTGGVLPPVVPITQSPCKGFQAQVLAQALDFQFVPAKKGDQPVNAWYQVVIHPIRQ
jgi:hypothetical protein